MITKTCRLCGDHLDKERAELGYDYCLKPDCQAAGIEPVELAAIGINKAADYYLRADEIVPPRLPDPGPAAAADDDEPTPPAPAPTRARIRRASTQLDADLEALFERFQRSEITARDLDRQRHDLIEQFNRKVRAENIRYRSLLRPNPGHSRSSRVS